MVEYIPCPSCNQKVTSQARNCPHCGVNLALAAISAERALQTSPALLDVPITPEILVPRLGESLIEKGQLTSEGLKQALEHQKQKEKLGQPGLIGQALLELGLIDRETLDQVVTEQILQLQTALQNANRDLEARVRERTTELEQALNRLAELNQLKSNFIANISHELRTPLTHIRGYLELIINDGLGPLNQDQADALAVMQRSEERLERLIEDLIEFSLVARGELTLQLAPTDLNELFEETLMKYMVKCENQGISLKADYPSDLPKIKGDAQKISWVLLQLMDNAVKFTDPGGRVQLGAKIDGNLVKIYVYDTGIGISPEKINEIFEPFHQLDSSATRRYGGTGLGLAMTRQIIEAHGSQISVQSKVGNGSYFEFTLPIEEDSKKD
jgi:signal transduction histidine kinase